MADVLTGAEGNIMRLAMVRTAWHCGVIEPIMLDIKDAHQLGRACRLSQPTENGGCQTDGRQSDNFIVLLKSGNADRGKEVTQ